MNAMTEPLHLLSNSHLDALEEETIFICLLYTSDAADE